MDEDTLHLVDCEYLCIRCEEFITDENWNLPCPGVVRERIEAQF